MSEFDSKVVNGVNDEAETKSQSHDGSPRPVSKEQQQDHVKSEDSADDDESEEVSDEGSDEASLAHDQDSKPAVDNSQTSDLSTNEVDNSTASDSDTTEKDEYMMTSQSTEKTEPMYLPSMGEKIIPMTSDWAKENDAPTEAIAAEKTEPPYLPSMGENIRPMTSPPAEDNEEVPTSSTVEEEESASKEPNPSSESKLPVGSSLSEGQANPKSTALIIAVLNRKTYESKPAVTPEPTRENKDEDDDGPTSPPAPETEKTEQPQDTTETPTEKKSEPAEETPKSPVSEKSNNKPSMMEELGKKIYIPPTSPFTELRYVMFSTKIRPMEDYLMKQNEPPLVITGSTRKAALTAASLAWSHTST